MIDPGLAIGYAIAGAVSTWLYMRGTKDKDKAQEVIAYIIAGSTVLTFFEWSGTYVILSAIETLIGAGITYSIMKDKD